jgi:Protein kinase domain
VAVSTECDKCGHPVAGDAPLGLCPNCLLRTAIEAGASQALAPLLPRLRYFGDYELLGEIARGGMGVVYRAKQVSLDRLVAVKMMRPGLLASEPEIRRFYAEARTAARLQHPNIVAIHEVGEFEGLHYFSMDFVEGPSLDALVRERPLSSEEAARYVQVLAEAVQYAHAQGILHRDLKPSNVLVDAGGRPRITDFGLARPLDGDSGSTVAGMVMGTPAYMPPEQAAGQHDRLSPASDVYSLGAILYELLTGRPPFRSGNQRETVRMVLEEEPARLRELSPQISRELETICLRCLEKEPAKRYGSAAELAGELGRFLRGEPGPMRLPAPRVRRWWLLAAAVCAVVPLAVFLVMRSGVRHEAVRKQPRASAPPPASMLFLPDRPLHTKAKAAPKEKATEKKAAEVPVTPVSFSISPDNGTGYNQSFTLRVTGPKGAEDIRTVELAFHDTAGNRDCAIFLEPEEGRVELQFNPAAGPMLRVAGNAGTLNRIENSVCTVDLIETSLTLQGNDLQAKLPVIFKPGFEGLKEIKSWAWDKKGNRAEGQGGGQWIVGPPAPRP